LSDRGAKIGAMNNYTYRAEWWYEGIEYVGRCLEVPEHLSHAPTALEAIRRIQEIVAGLVADMEDCGTEPPDSLSDRRYSGNFVVRTSPELHARLVIEANEQRVSLNHWAVSKLAGRKPPSLDDFF
jgi:predicted RNase H-like HicB family nuclease